MSNFIQHLRSYAEKALDRTHPKNGNWLKAKRSQQEALQDYIKDIEAGIKSGYIKLPTGVGKTALFVAIVKCFFEVFGHDPENNIVIAVPTKELVENTARELAQFTDYIKIDKDEEIDWKGSEIVGVVYSKAKFTGRPITITTYPSLHIDSKRDEGERLLPPEKTGLLILDEAQFLTGDQYSLIPTRYSDKTLVLGTTATPDYSEEKRVGTILKHVYYSLPMYKAIEREEIAPYRTGLVKTNVEVDYSKIRTYKDSRGEAYYNEKELEKALNTAARNQAAISTFINYLDPDTGERLMEETGLVECSSVAHAQDLAQLWNKNFEEDANLKQWCIDRGFVDAEGKPRVAVAVDGNMPHKELSKIYRDHRHGKIPVLCYKDLLGVGTNFTADSFMMGLSNTLSVNRAEQRGGRPSRLNSKDPYKLAKVFDFIDRNWYEENAEIPQNLPVFMSEILGDKYEFRLRRKREGVIAKYTPPPSTDHGTFECVTDLATVRGVTASMKKKHKAVAATPAPKGWFSAEDLTKLGYPGYKISSQKLAEYYEAKIRQIEKKAYQGKKRKRRPKKNMLVNFTGRHPKIAYV